MSSFPLGPVVGNRFTAQHQHKPRLLAALQPPAARVTALGTVSQDASGKLQFVPNYAKQESKPAPAKPAPAARFKAGERVRIQASAAQLHGYGITYESAVWMSAQPSLLVDGAHEQSDGAAYSLKDQHGYSWAVPGRFVAAPTPEPQTPAAHQTALQAGADHYAWLQGMARSLEPVQVHAPDWAEHGLLGYISRLEVAVTSAHHNELRVSVHLENSSTLELSGDEAVQVLRKAPAPRQEPAELPRFNCFHDMATYTGDVQVHLPGHPKHGLRGRIDRMNTLFDGDALRVTAYALLEDGTALALVGDKALDGFRRAFDPLKEPLAMGDQAEVDCPGMDAHGKRGVISQITRDSRCPEDATYELTLEGVPARMIQFHSRRLLKLLRKAGSVTLALEGQR
jgi:hypothetical protein